MGIIILPDLSIKPDLSFILTSAKPSLKSPISSYLRGITNFPTVSIAPHFSLRHTDAKPSE